MSNTNPPKKTGVNPGACVEEGVPASISQLLAIIARINYFSNSDKLSNHKEENNN
jgi:hypothetical protein